jgi:outer membrane protein assembly factor BamD
MNRRVITPCRRAPAVLVSFALLLAVGGCRSGPKQDPILKLSAVESLSQGKTLMADKKYGRARPYLLHAFEVEPNSVTGREALLLVADTFYFEGGSTNYIQAEAKYRDFLNRFPTSDRAPYVQLQIGNSLAERMERPDRDQTTTRKALAAFEDLLRLYPTSEYAAQARDKINQVRDNLAEHEFLVGQFYFRFGLPKAAAARLEYLLATYPEYSHKDKVLYYLGRSYLKGAQPTEAAQAFKRLRAEFPDSPYTHEAPASSS